MATCQDLTLPVRADLLAFRSQYILFDYNCYRILYFILLYISLLYFTVLQMALRAVMSAGRLSYLFIFQVNYGQNHHGFFSSVFSTRVWNKKKEYICYCRLHLHILVYIHTYTYLYVHIWWIYLHIMGPPSNVFFSSTAYFVNGNT